MPAIRFLSLPTAREDGFTSSRRRSKPVTKASVQSTQTKGPRIGAPALSFLDRRYLLAAVDALRP